MLSAQLTEYANTSCSSSVGLTWEFHHKCKVIFEVRRCSLFPWLFFQQDWTEMNQRMGRCEWDEEWCVQMRGGK